AFWAALFVGVGQLWKMIESQPRDRGLDFFRTVNGHVVFPRTRERGRCATAQGEKHRLIRSKLRAGLGAEQLADDFRLNVDAPPMLALHDCLAPIAKGE